MPRIFRDALIVFAGLMLFCAAASAQSGAGAAAGREVKEGPATRATLIKEQGRKMSQAFIAGNFEALLDATYPKILELAGGRAKMLAVLKAEVAKWEAQKIKVLSYEVGEPGEIKSAGAKLVSVVPAEIKMEFPEAVYSQKSFMLAVSADGGKVWKFISGSHLNDEALKLLVPEAVGVVSLPKAVEPVVERKP